MIRLCEAVYRKKLVSPRRARKMLEHLRACEDNDKFPRFLPPGPRSPSRPEASPTPAPPPESSNGRAGRSRSAS